MPVILRIAVRNLKEHRLKSFIIMSLIALGMILLVFGNSVIDTGKAGIERALIKTFSGHILVGPKGENGQMPSLLGSSGGFGAMGGGKAPEVIRDFPRVLESLKTFPGVAEVNPQVYGMELAVLEGNWRAGMGTFGVDPVQYRKMFPDAVELLEGHFLEADEPGIMLSDVMYQDITKDAGMKDLKVGDKLKLQSFGAGNSKIKSVPIVGIFRFNTEFSSMQELSFLDLSSQRYLLGMVVGGAGQVDVSEDATAMLGTDLSEGFDSFFDGPLLADDAGASPESPSAKVDFDNLLGDTSRRDELTRADDGSWMYILLRLQDPDSLEATIKALNDKFAAEGSNLVAVDWQTASGALAVIIGGIQIFFFILVLIITIVSVIVIMNTMVVSIMERTGEIGTMRALGARKSYIRSVFMAETFTLAVAGGLVGLVLGTGIIAILHALGMPAPNPLFEMVFGGKILHPVLTPSSAVAAMVIMILVGVLSGLYPTSIALRIQPVKAMQNS